MNRETAILAAALSLALPFAAFAAPKLKKERNSDPVVRLKTNMGDIYLELFPREAPKTVRNFMALAEGKKEFTDPKTGKKVKRRYYDGLIFHRVIKDFMLQGGCPQGNGRGGPGFKFEDEINAKALGLHKEKALRADGSPHPHLGVRSQRDFQRVVMGPLYRKMAIKSQADLDAKRAAVDRKVKAMTLKDVFENAGYLYSAKLNSRPPTRGVLAMANSGPNTNGSQFFINLVDTPWLTGKHTVFGKVIRGMSVVDKIGDVRVASGARPVKDVRIISIRVVDRGGRKKRKKR